jgi:hypothetical protein
MPRTAYTVIATLPDPQTADEYVRWLTGGHIAAVLRGGAESGMVVRIEEPAAPLQVESRYVFPSREGYDRYIREVAPDLRADGLRKFGPERGIRMERRLGTIV